MNHEMHWDNGKAYCICGWISNPTEAASGSTQNRRDQQQQFLDHKQKEEGIQLSDSDQ